MKYNNVREEELKNKVGSDFFASFDTTEIIGNIDFSVHPKQKDLFWHKTPFLRAEAKTGKYDVPTMFVQLILTIGKARTFDKTLPPLFLWAFDFEKIAFLEYNQISDIFYQNDFNWNVTPSNHETREFGIVKQRVANILEKNTLIFDYEKDHESLRSFIKSEFKEQGIWSQIKINNNNFFPIYLKRLEFVKPHINADRELYKRNGILDADFFLADLFVDDKNTQIIIDDESVKLDLFVIFRNWGYQISKENLNSMFDAIIEIKNVKQYEFFWKNYKRPPAKLYHKYIIQRRDLLVPQDIRERKWAYFTPRIRVEKSQEYMAEYFGENYQDEYYIRDCAAGTGNLLAGLTNKYNIYASTLDMADVQVMKEMADLKTANLLKEHIFQFDFLNDGFDKLPQSLQDIINDPEKRKKLIIYINPPYAETATNKTTEEGRINKRWVSFTEVQKKYSEEIWIATKELFAQFLYRIYKEIPNCKIANFSKLKNLQGANFEKFRECFLAKLEKIFIVPGNTFDNVKGQFPIWFFIWNCEIQEKFEEIYADIFDKDWNFIWMKYIFAPTKFLTDRYKPYHTRQKGESIIGAIWLYWSDFQHNNFIRITNVKNHPNRYTFISKENLLQTTIYLAVRHCVEATRLNDRDQFLRPNDERKTDTEFHSDCLIFTLFHGQNRITSRENDGVNYRIPFTEAEVDAKERFASDFMSSYLKQFTLSPDAKKVYEAWLELWKYYHQQEFEQGEYLANASFYEIKEYFQWRNDKGRMNSKSSDETYNQLIGKLRDELKNLAGKIAEKVYEYEFLRR